MNWLGAGSTDFWTWLLEPAKMEAGDPNLKITDDVLLELWSKVKDDYPDGHVATREDAYNVFAPLNEGTVSKTITAQYLAGMISGELPPVKGDEELKGRIKDLFLNDERLKYLKDAIEYVTT